MNYTANAIATSLYSIDFMDGSKLPNSDKTNLVLLHLNHKNGKNSHYVFMTTIKKILQIEHNISMTPHLYGTYISPFTGRDNVEKPTHFVSLSGNIYRLYIPIPFNVAFEHAEQDILRFEAKMTPTMTKDCSPQNSDAFTFLFQPFEPIKEETKKDAETTTKEETMTKTSAICVIQSHMRMVKARKVLGEKLSVVTKNVSKNDGMIYKVLPKVSILRRKRFQPLEMMNIDRDYTRDRFDYIMNSESDSDSDNEEEE